MTREIPLTRGKVAIVDDDDFPALNVYRWTYLATHRGVGYASRRISIDGKPKVIMMHNEIGRPSPGLVVDHINGDGLDNRRSNLRCVTRSINNLNRRAKEGSASGYPGVTLLKSGRWWARIHPERRKCVSLGCYATKEEAIAARKAGESRLLTHPLGILDRPASVSP